MSSTPFVIGLVAERGAGKGMFVELVKELLIHKSVIPMKFSDIIREILIILNKPIARENFSILTTALREGFRDEGILVGAMKKKIESAQTDVIILDGIRRAEEVPFIREMDGVVVHITADQKIRFERRTSIPEKTDEFGMSWESFLTQDQLPTEITIRHIGETMSDTTIDNSGSIEAFKERIIMFLRDHKFL